MRDRIIIIEGPQGAGKTTTTDYIRHAYKHVNLYRMSGIPDNSKEGLEKSKKMYFNLIKYIENMQGVGLTLLFDRTFFTEENYCRLGYKDYSFTEIYDQLVTKLNLLNFDIYYITLYLEDTSIYEKRLNRKGKDGPSYAKYLADNSISQQNEYLKMANEIEERYDNIKVFCLNNDGTGEEMQEKIDKILKTN